MKVIETPNGSKITVGQSALENDRLRGAPDDWWFHAQDSPGAHVLLQGPATPECIQTAARLAIQHSKSKGVFVDMCRFRDVKRTKTPGLVTIRNSNTVNILGCVVHRRSCM